MQKKLVIEQQCTTVTAIFVEGKKLHQLIVLLVMKLDENVLIGASKMQ